MRPWWFGDCALCEERSGVEGGPIEKVPHEGRPVPPHSCRPNLVSGLVRTLHVGSLFGIDYDSIPYLYEWWHREAQSGIGFCGLG